jgi:hypothetical protein
MVVGGNYDEGILARPIEKRETIEVNPIETRDLGLRRDTRVGMSYRRPTSAKGIRTYMARESSEQ